MSPDVPPTRLELYAQRDVPTPGLTPGFDLEIIKFDSEWPQLL